MKIRILLIITLFVSLCATSQELIYKSTGRVFNSNNEKLSPSEVRELLAKKPGMLNFYNDGRSRKTAGNVLLIGGLAVLATDFLIAAGSESQVNYPTVATVIGAVAIIISIPIKIGNGRKVREMVKEYNKQLKNETALNIEEIKIINNQNGVGMRVSF